MRFCINFGAIVIFCAWNRKRSNMTHCCYIFSVRLKLIKTCFDLLKSAKTRMGLFQIDFQNTNWKLKLGLHKSYFFQFQKLSTIKKKAMRWIKRRDVFNVWNNCFSTFQSKVPNQKPPPQKTIKTCLKNVCVCKRDTRSFNF